MGGKQLGCRFAQSFAYGDYKQTTSKKRTRREKFIDEMDQVVPWQALIGLIEPHYPRNSKKGGHRRRLREDANSQPLQHLRS